MKRYCECRGAMVHSLGACIGCEDKPEPFEPAPFMDTTGDITCPADVPADVWEIALRDAVEASVLVKPLAEVIAQAILADRRRRGA